MRRISDGIYFDKFWLSYFLVRIAYLFLAVFVYSKFTQLGDTNRYLNAGVFFSSNMFIESTVMMDVLGSISKLIFRVDFLANLPFTLLSFFSIKYAVKSMKISRNKYLIFFLLSMPSFCIWTSVCSKEAISVFYISILSVYLFRIIEHGSVKPKMIEILALYLCGLFKIVYLIYIFQAILLVAIIRRLNLKGYRILIVSFCCILLNLIILYIARDEIDLFSKGMAIYFEADTAFSTRPNTIWVNNYDVYRNAPYAMYISFIGPTIHEMINNPLHLLTGLESYTILVIFLYLLYPAMSRIVKHGKVDILFTSYGFIMFTGVLFVHAFYGALNPGSAVRYRENFYLLFVLFLVYQFNKVQKRDLYLKAV